MTLDELITLITSSHPEDWHTTVCWGADSGPSYRDHLNFFQVYDGQSNVLFAKAHPLVACYKPDLSVTMAWGLDENTDFGEPWANKFPDPKAASHYIDIFYNNALVFRTLYVSVDGGRANLPLPESADELSVPRAYNALIRLIDHISGTRISEYDTYFRRAGFQLSRVSGLQHPDLILSCRTEHIRWLPVMGAMLRKQLDTATSTVLHYE